MMVNFMNLPSYRQREEAIAESQRRRETATAEADAQRQGEEARDEAESRREIEEPVTVAEEAEDLAESIAVNNFVFEESEGEDNYDEDGKSEASEGEVEGEDSDGGEGEGEKGEGYATEEEVDLWNEANIPDPYAPSDEEVEDQRHDDEEEGPEILSLGKTFRSASEFKKSLLRYSLTTGYDIKLSKSDKRLRYDCYQIHCNC